MRATDQDGSPPCRIITVATGRAASAAADLLTAGDYALVFPETVLHCHGVRYPFADPVTVEAASFVAESLKLSNDQYAFTEARRCIFRFMFRCVYLRSEFTQIREKSSDTNLDDLACLYLALCNRVSPRTLGVLEQAYERFGRYQQLSGAVRKALNSDPSWQNRQRLADTEAAILRAILAFEVETNTDPDWRFEGPGLRQLRDDFLLLTEYLGPQQNKPLEPLAQVWGDFFLTDQDKSDLENLRPEQRVEERSKRLTPLLRPIWFFFVALCHVLQEGENELTAHDAYWLGLIDEIIGDPELPCVRALVEHAADLTSEEPADSK